MHILHSLLSELKEEFATSRKSEERGPWFVYTLLAIILPFTSSRTSNLLRALEVLFGFSIRKKKYYRFMASPKIPWSRLWPRLWKLIPEPETNGRLLVVLDDFINPKTGQKIFGCANVFDHAAKLKSVKISLGTEYCFHWTPQGNQRSLGVLATEPLLLSSQKGYRGKSSQVQRQGD